MSLSSRTNNISIAIPILFIALMIGSLIGIIGNSLLVNSSESGFDNNFSSSSQSKEFRIFKIIVSVILTSIFLLLTIFSLIEIIQPGDYRAKIITSKLDNWLLNTYDNLESWELLLILSNFILLPVGIATSLIQGGREYFIISAVSVVIVYFSYSQRIGTRKAIKAALPNHKKISLIDLSKLISKDLKYVRKALIHLASFEKFPITYNYASGMVTYDGPIPSRTSINERVVEPDMQLRKPKSQTNTTTQ
ncbi:MAG: hypothetical protein ACC656_06155, partial [Candidatus Heimdallarchaeota archaeon]